MNRRLILTLMLTALALTAFPSCTGEENAPASADVILTGSAMQFSPYLGRSKNSVPYTKGDEGDDPVNPLGEGGSFNMRAYYNIDATHRQPFYSCVEYKWDGEKYFVSSPVYYWPVSGTVDFYAVSPTTFTPDSVLSVTVTDGRADLIAAKALARTRSTSVALTFGHKLTKLSFKVVGADPTLSYEITSIKVNALSSATLHYGLEGADFGWTGAATPKDYEYFYTDGKLVIPVSTTEALAATGLMMLIPTQTDVNLSVTYTARYGDSEVASGTKTVSLNSSLIKWDINKHITYTLNLTPDATPITFTATTTDWDVQADQPQSIIAVTSITLSSSTLDLEVGGTSTLTATVAPSGASNKSVTWSTNAAGVATVDETGLVTAVGAGEATITATAADGSGVTEQCTVTVTKPPLLSGVFTVGAGTDGKAGTDDDVKVKFSKGNLWWDGSAADHMLIVDGQGDLYALSSAQWCYLLNTDGSSGRTDANRFAMAMVNSVNGIIIFPDGYTTVPSDAGIATVNATSVEFPTTSIADATWTSMESSGCVFLPAAGSRGGTNLSSAGSFGFYCSSTPYVSELAAYSLCFINGGVNPSSCTMRSTGISVRLVCSVTE